MNKAAVGKTLRSPRHAEQVIELDLQITCWAPTKDLCLTSGFLPWLPQQTQSSWPTHLLDLDSVHRRGVVGRGLIVARVVGGAGARVGRERQAGPSVPQGAAVSRHASTHASPWKSERVVKVSLGLSNRCMVRERPSLTTGKSSAPGDASILSCTASQAVVCCAKLWAFVAPRTPLEAKLKSDISCGWGMQSHHIAADLLASS